MYNSTPIMVKAVLVKMYSIERALETELTVSGSTKKLSGLIRNMDAILIKKVQPIKIL
jgi:hypothetical protein